MTNIIRVGIAVLAFNAAGEFLMGQRLNTHGAGAWALPGGTMEFGESFADCVRREMLEETGLHVDHIETISIANHLFPEHNKHFVAIYCAARIVGDPVPVVKEPHKCERWQFFSDWNNLPQPLFVDYMNEAPATLIDQYRQRVSPNAPLSDLNKSVINSGVQ
jgi:8-oxo-dGTP diphosphatase